MSQLLTPEDSKRVADAAIREIQTISAHVQREVKFTLPNSVERGICTGIQSSLGYSQYGKTQAFQAFLADVKAIIASVNKP